MGGGGGGNKNIQNLYVHNVEFEYFHFLLSNYTPETVKPKIIFSGGEPVFF